MLRIRKIERVQALHRLLLNSGFVLVVRHHGLTASDSNQIRQLTREIGARFQVTKNSLIRRALQETPFDSLIDDFTQANAVILSDDPIAVAKTVVKYAKNNPKIWIVGASIPYRRLSEPQVKSLTELPSLEVLRGKLASLIAQPATRVVRSLSHHPQQIHTLIRQPSSQLARLLRMKPQ